MFKNRNSCRTECIAQKNAFFYMHARKSEGCIVLRAPILKVLVDDKYSIMVSDRGDRCLFIFM
jgi:hypothetical protein